MLTTANLKENLWRTWLAALSQASNARHWSTMLRTALIRLSAWAILWGTS